MSKKKSRKKRKATPIQGRSPAALFRFAVRDDETRAIIDASVLSKVTADDLQRDGAPLVDAAESPRELVETVGKLRRGALRVWEMKLRELPSPDVAPLLGEVLDALYTHPDDNHREQLYDAVIGALRWMDEPGSAVLLSRFDGLPPTAASRAAVALGLMGCEEAADKLRAWYLAVRAQPGYTHAGALWGLAELRAAGITELLIDEFARNNRLPELYDLCLLAGEAGLVPPLLLDLHQTGARGPLDTLYAIYWRVGREAFLESVTSAGLEAEVVTPLADVFAESEPSESQIRELRGEPTPVLQE